MKRSEQINELAMALSKAQKNFKPILKKNTAKIRTKAGYEFSYNYAGISEILEAVRDPLAENGLSVSQTSDVLSANIGSDGKEIISNRVIITTLLMHSSGQWIENDLTLPVVDVGNNAVQAIGSTITYGRRYEISSVLGIASEEDVDGNTANDSVKKGNTPAANKAPEPKKPDAPDFKETLRTKLNEAFDSKGAAITKFLGEECGVEKLSEVTREQIPLAISKLNQIIKDKVKK